MLFLGLLLLLSLATFDPRDPSLNHAVSGAVPIFNKAGRFGAYCSGLLVDMLGLAGYIVPAFLLTAGGRRVLASPEWQWWRWCSFLLLTCCLAVGGQAWDAAIVRVRGGGLLGRVLHDFSIDYFSPVGTALVWGFGLLLAAQTLFGISWLTLMRRGSAIAARWANRQMAAMAERRQRNREQKAALTASREAMAMRAETPSQATRREETVSRPLPEVIPAAGNDDNDEPHFFRTPEPEVDSFTSPGPVFRMRDPEPEPEVLAQGEDSPGLDFLTDPLDESDPPWLRDLEEGSIQARAVRAPRFRDPIRQGAEISAPPRAEASMEPEETTGAPSASSSFGKGRDGSSIVPRIVAGNAGMPATKNSSVSPAERAEPIVSARKKSIPLPSLDLVHAAAGNAAGTPRAVLEAKGKALMTCLTDFGIQGELSAITPGPVVTMFEVRPAPGVKVSRIANLSDDLALALKAIAVRIQAPIPGSDVVGIEIPNEIRETVCLKELFASSVFQKSESLLTMALGKDIAGTSVVADLARMPHLLVAGATGAGKSVCLNSILLSFLYKARPEQVKLLLVDPKRIEMAVYADLPHLVHPVVTEMALAKNALEWAVSEMDERYKAIGRLKVRNIATYNEKLAELGDNKPPDLADLEFMPYLVVVIDELADLMLTAAKEVETSIVRLAQLARAAGIHMILATQRPSVDVVTGLIKANFPCRISFQVTSKHDSRTILDAVGAEHLLGKGDMLYKPSGGRFQRLHGAFVSDEDVAAVTEYWRARQRPDYTIDFTEWGGGDGGEEFSGGGSGMDDVAADAMYSEAVEFVRQQGKASISLIQRRFRIGFNRAARFVEQMEKDGIIGPADGSKPRTVVR